MVFLLNFPKPGGWDPTNKQENNRVKTYIRTTTNKRTTNWQQMNQQMWRKKKTGTNPNQQPTENNINQRWDQSIEAWTAAYNKIMKSFNCWQIVESCISWSHKDPWLRWFQVWVLGALAPFPAAHMLEWPQQRTPEGCTQTNQYLLELNLLTTNMRCFTLSTSKANLYVHHLITISKRNSNT